MPHEGWDTARLPKSRQGNREEEVGFEPRTSWSVNSRSNHLNHVASVENKNEHLFVPAILHEWGEPDVCGVHIIIYAPTILLVDNPTEMTNSLSRATRQT
ncbi:hypothetical protein T265_06937 [Opisthorchis viverrini]|uniref:Uncharacterized protein n=1 Tax=Opisthorchis viverrini TaxID=6198 RepID=A0A074ZIQ1_OPIVI|nr:hypothetical protein T265_06937 [Opisthorchis viverrini]KER25647.1 hypothetical protein T265_06937 [Opisthorchis viverrini]